MQRRRSLQSVLYNQHNVDRSAAGKQVADDHKRWPFQFSEYQFSKGLYLALKDGYIVMTPVTWTGIDVKTKKTVVNTYVYAIAQPNSMGAYVITSIWNDSKQLLQSNTKP